MAPLVDPVGKCSSLHVMELVCQECHGGQIIAVPDDEGGFGREGPASHGEREVVSQNSLIPKTELALLRIHPAGGCSPCRVLMDRYDQLYGTWSSKCRHTFIASLSEILWKLPSENLAITKVPYIIRF